MDLGLIPCGFGLTLTSVSPTVTLNDIHEKLDKAVMSEEVTTILREIVERQKVLEEQNRILLQMHQQQQTMLEKVSQPKFTESVEVQQESYSWTPRRRARTKKGFFSRLISIFDS
jgi:hypothetical protein